MQNDSPSVICGDFSFSVIKKNIKTFNQIILRTLVASSLCTLRDGSASCRKVRLSVTIFCVYMNSDRRNPFRWQYASQYSDILSHRKK